MLCWRCRHLDQIGYIYYFPWQDSHFEVIFPAVPGPQMFSEQSQHLMSATGCRIRSNGVVQICPMKKRSPSSHFLSLSFTLIKILTSFQRVEMLCIWLACIVVSIKSTIHHSPVVKSKTPPFHIIRSSILNFPSKPFLQYH